MVACYFDPSALRTARRKNAAPNVTYVLADIRDDMPQGSFDTVLWDNAIEHFTPDEINTIVPNIKRQLKSGGILSGSTIVQRKDGRKSLEHHEYEFKSKEDLSRFLEPHFKHVAVFETVYPTRHNLYFYASDAVIPFSPGWGHMASATRGGK